MRPHDVLASGGQSSGTRCLAPRAGASSGHNSPAPRSLDGRCADGGLGRSDGVAFRHSRPIPSPFAAMRGATPAVLETRPAPGEARSALVDFGYPRDIDAKYAWGAELGKGGNGTVRVVHDRATGESYACKAIRKVLQGEHSEVKHRNHHDSIRREVEVLRRLDGSLNIVRLVDVFEDEDAVYLVQELCKGGELWHRIGEHHYSERTVASFMRAVLRTIAQCHSHHILHRDIKPGNFMLLDDGDAAYVKAIDFGLAMPFDPEDLPRSDLGLEGTPWYMAPEVLSSQVTPAADVWSAGVMAHQLLTGRLPFDDRRNPFAPSISAVWRSVLQDKVDYNMPWWQDISDEAKDFVRSLLDRDPANRPSAKEALKHPWLQGNSSERSSGKQIDVSVVARIQRFAQNNRFKRSVLRLIAEELLARPGAMEAESAASAQRTASKPPGGSTGSGGIIGDKPIIQDPNAGVMQEIYSQLQLDDGKPSVDRDAAALALAGMGYRLDPAEVSRLLEQVDTSNSGRVSRAALAASQIDWRHLQANRVDDWLEIAHAAFATLDADSDGRISAKDIMDTLRAKLPPAELRMTVQQAMLDAGQDADADHMDFDGFLHMLKAGSMDSLEQYDARLGRSLGVSASSDRLLLDSSLHDSEGSGSVRGQHAGWAASYGAAAAAAPGLRRAGSGGAHDDDSSWTKPPVNFRFDFGAGFYGHRVPPAASAAGQSATGSAHDIAQQRDSSSSAEHPPVVAPPASNNNGRMTAASYFNTGAVRGGGHFDKRMHGASLYRNAVVVPPPSINLQGRGGGALHQALLGGSSTKTSLLVPVLE